MVMELSEVMPGESIEEMFQGLKVDFEEKKRNACPAKRRQVEQMIARWINGRLPYNKRNYNLGVD